MIDGSSKILMSKKILEYSICFISISLAAVDSLLNDLKVHYSISNPEEIFHSLYIESHNIFHLRTFQAQSLIISPKPGKNIFGAI